jgi:demethylmenaquinone methyltransferase/2-methoxy-6-polyprenyl-1,4-benzoquinol methylase
MNQDELLQEQLDYYRARAREYDASLEAITSQTDLAQREDQREWAALIQAVRRLGPCGAVLELAAGTGIWTQELLPLASELTVLDGSAEMLEINRARINDPRARYVCADLFTWEPRQEFDLVFFALWLSHVPRDWLGGFLDRVGRAVRPGGRLFLMDEPAGGNQLSGPSEDGMVQRRTVEDGREFRIFKIYYDPAEIREQLRQRGFEPVETMVGRYFFFLSSQRSGEW